MLNKHNLKNNGLSMTWGAPEVQPQWQGGQLSTKGWREQHSALGGDCCSEGHS